MLTFSRATVEKRTHCPFIERLFHECYSSNLTSLQIPFFIHYCAADFARCEVFRKLSGGRIAGSASEKRGSVVQGDINSSPAVEE